MKSVLRLISLKRSRAEKGLYSMPGLMSLMSMMQRAKIISSSTRPLLFMDRSNPREMQESRKRTNRMSCRMRQARR
jgi:hypothetical protein